MTTSIMSGISEDKIRGLLRNPSLIEVKRHG